MRPPLQVNLQPFYLESGVRVTCDVAYLCANFNLPPGPLCSLDLGPMYATDRQTSGVRQTDVRRTSSLNAPYPRGRAIISFENTKQLAVGKQF